VRALKSVATRDTVPLFVPHHTLLTGLAHLPQLQGGEDPQDAWALGKRRVLSPGASRAPQGSDYSSTDCSEPVFALFFPLFSKSDISSF